MLKKSQIESIDLFIAVTVFLILSVTTVYTWNLYTTRLNENLGYDKMQFLAFHITDVLVKSPGYPTGWEDAPSNVETIGLAENDRVLSQDKVTAFINLDYNTSRSAFRMKPHEYKFRIKDFSRNTLQESGVNFTGDISIVTERYVLLDNEKRIMEFTVWK